MTNELDFRFCGNHKQHLSVARFLGNLLTKSCAIWDLGSTLYCVDSQLPPSTLHFAIAIPLKALNTLFPMSLLARRLVDAMMRAHSRKKALLLTAAAALSTTLPTSSAFVAQPPRNPTIAQSLPIVHSNSNNNRPLQSRLYSSQRNSDDEGGILGGLKKAAKSILPSSWFQSEKEKKAAIQRQRMKEEVTGGLQEVLKDAPFPVRMMGKMMGPLMSNMMSGLAETMAEQQEQVDQVLADTKTYLMADPAVGRLLGDGAIQVGTPFSQSSSSSTINGQTTTRVEIAMPVTGSRSSGVAQAVSSNGRLDRLVLQADGRTINVSMASKTPRSSAFRSASSKRDDDIIEAEIIEKESKN